MKICARCKTTNDKNRSFCKQCGLMLINNNAIPPTKAEYDYNPIELKVADYSLSADLLACQAINEIPLIKTVVELYIKKWNKPMEQRKLLGDAVLVGKSNLQSIFNLVEYAAKVINVKQPEVYVKYDPQYSAYTLGTNNDNMIVLHSSLVNDFSEQELLFVIGHEMGHIKSQHVTYISVGSMMAGGAAVLGDININPLLVPLNAWSRQAEHTADRAGYLICQSEQSSLSSIIMLALGSRRLLEDFNIESYLKQREKLKDFYGKINKWFGGYDHPYIVERVYSLLEFIYSDKSIKLLALLKEQFPNNIFNKMPILGTPNKALNTQKIFCRQCGIEINEELVCPFCNKIF